MLPRIWKPTLRSISAQNYSTVAEEDNKFAEDSLLPTEGLDRQAQAVKKLKLLLKIAASLLVFLLGVILILLLPWSPKVSNEPLLKTPVPELPLTITTFEKTDIYAARTNPESDKAWNDLLPPGRGFIYLPPDQPPSTFPYLKPGQPTPWGPIYSISLFHQLHCLAELRKYYHMLLDGILTDSPDDFLIAKKKAEMLAGIIDDGGGHGGQGSHVGHCIDYIRQGIMCAGDMSLETPREEPDGKEIAVDGWGMQHVCRSWDVISDYMDKWHFNHSSRMDIAPDK